MTDALAEKGLEPVWIEAGADPKPGTAVHNECSVQRKLIGRSALRLFRAKADRTWVAVTAAAWAITPTSLIAPSATQSEDTRQAYWRPNSQRALKP